MKECELHADPDANPKECDIECLYSVNNECQYKQHKQRLLECGDMRSTITMLAKDVGMRRVDIKQELQDVQTRMRLNKICEDYCGKSLLDARPSDIAEVRKLVREEPASEYLIEQLDKCITLITEYNE